MNDSESQSHFGTSLDSGARLSYPRPVYRRVLGAGGALRRLCRGLKEAGPVIRRRDLISLRRQFCEQAWIYARYDFESRDYYQYRLYESAQRSQVDSYLSIRQNGRLLRSLLFPDLMVWDKIDFARSCAAHDLPAIPSLAEWRDGTLTSLVDEWPESFYSKPARSMHGSGAGVRSWQGGSAVVPELERHLRDHDTGQGAVVQPRIFTHPDLMPLTNGCLATLRITGCRMPDGAIELLLPTFRMPQGASVVDNFQKGNLVAPVCLQTGCLGVARSRDAHAVISTVDVHPESGERIEGTRVPFFSEALATCRRAHQLICRPPLIGWDVAITADGPVLVEGNHMFGTEVAQVAHGSPIAQPAYVTSARHHLKDRTWRRASVHAPQ